MSSVFFSFCCKNERLPSSSYFLLKLSQWLIRFLAIRRERERERERKKRDRERKEGCSSAKRKSKRGFHTKFTFLWWLSLLRFFHTFLYMYCTYGSIERNVVMQFIVIFCTVQYCAIKCIFFSMWKSPFHRMCVTRAAATVRISVIQYMGKELSVLLFPPSILALPGYIRVMRHGYFNLNFLVWNRAVLWYKPSADYIYPKSLMNTCT